MQNSAADDKTQLEEEEKQIEVKKNKVYSEHQNPLTRKTTEITTTEQSTISTTENRMIIILDGKTNARSSSKKENLTAQATKENAWPEFKESSTYPTQNKELPAAKTLYPWQNRAPNKNPFQRNFGFAYHRVTGKPSAHLSSPELNHRTHNAYIAVSVIAPKEHYDRKDKLLENQLRQLKPWNHNQNLKNMATIRSNWVIQNDENDGENRVDGNDKRG